MSAIERDDPSSVYKAFLSETEEEQDDRQDNSTGVSLYQVGAVDATPAEETSAKSRTVARKAVAAEPSDEAVSAQRPIGTSQRRHPPVACCFGWSIPRQWMLFLVILLSVAGLVAVAVYLTVLRDSQQQQQQPLEPLPDVAEYKPGWETKS